MRKLTTLILIAATAGAFGDFDNRANSPAEAQARAESAKSRPAKKKAKSERNPAPAKAQAVPTEKSPAKKSTIETPKPVLVPKDAAPDSVKAELEQLTAENALAAEREKKATAKLREQVNQLKLEKEQLTETLALQDLHRKSKQLDLLLKRETEKEKLLQEAAMAKARAEKIAHDLKAQQAQWQAKTAKLEAEMEEFEIRQKRDGFADRKPVYLDSPLKEDGTLVISDRRIELNGPVTSRSADHVTTRINYYNNKDPKLPIFIVIDDSPGGSVMSGYRILKAMEGSEAPVHVVVKSFAASMAATIATLAEKSYAYPNAVILHHQVSLTLFGRLNLTQQKELLDESRKWWKRLATPIADKMGLTTDEFVKRMYAKSTSGDWSEFADDAVKLKWVDHTVERIHETSLVRDPDAKSTPTPTVTRSATIHGLTEELDEDGRPVMYLPRTNPRDFYFLYNPDNYYQLR